MPSEDMSKFTHRLRSFTWANIAEDVKLACTINREGKPVLSVRSIINGYRKWQDPVFSELRDASGAIVVRNYTHNLRTNGGGTWLFNQMTGTTNGSAKYLALANDGITPAATDTFLGGNGGATNTEITDSSLTRQLATTVSLTTTPAGTTATAAGIFRLGFTWNPSATKSTINKVGVYNIATKGGAGDTLVLEALLPTTVNVISGDQLTVNYDVTF